MSADLPAIPQQPGRRAAIFTGFACVACGAWVLGLATGVLPTQPGVLQAPPWVVGCAGLVFVAGGLVPLNAAFGLPGWLNRWAAIGVIAGLATVFNWTAFFPGERHFTAMFFVPGMHTSAAAGALTGRIVFGCGALCADTLLLWALWRQLRGPRAPR